LLAFQDSNMDSLFGFVSFWFRPSNCAKTSLASFHRHATTAPVPPDDTLHDSLTVQRPPPHPFNDTKLPLLYSPDHYCNTFCILIGKTLVWRGQGYECWSKHSFGPVKVEIEVKHSGYTHEPSLPCFLNLKSTIANVCSLLLLNYA
jgi:hypothetical protein